MCKISKDSTAALNIISGSALAATTGSVASTSSSVEVFKDVVSSETAARLFGEFSSSWLFGVLNGDGTSSVGVKSESKVSSTTMGRGDLGSSTQVD